MTAFATMAALLPLAIGVSGEGGIISKSLGVVVIGGLALATFGTLVIVPAAYSVLTRGKREERRRKDQDESMAGSSKKDKHSFETAKH
jgi:HAE1 family hydrophobic/amphiphilic exporter-1